MIRRATGGRHEILPSIRGMRGIPAAYAAARLWRCRGMGVLKCG